MNSAHKLESIVVVTKRTPLEELINRFNSRAQARFYIEHAGLSFKEYESGHEEYVRALDVLRKQLPAGIKNQIIERSYLPTFKFSEHDLVIPVGPDGLVINTAKYLNAQPILALNPDPRRVDGVLIPFQVGEAGYWIDFVFKGKTKYKQVSMAQAMLNDGQKLYGVNDLFIGVRTHVAARYRIEFSGQDENQISSGIIVSTGAGSTGWLQSIVTGAAHISNGFIAGGKGKIPKEKEYRLDWESEDLYFSVREPFTSRISQAGLVFGKIISPKKLIIHSHMPENGVIFSDGIEEDYLSFNSGTIATVSIADKKANLVIK